MTPKRILVMGSINMDLVTVVPHHPAPGETLTATSFTTLPGGKGANQAVACARLSRTRPAATTTATTPSNITVEMWGNVGADSFGKDLIAGLTSESLITTHIHQSTTHPTGISNIIVDGPTGENRIMFNPGANYLPTPTTTSIPLTPPLPDLLVLQLEIPTDVVISLIREAKEKGIPVLLNPAPAPPDGTLPADIYDGLDHLILNETEASILSHTPLPSPLPSTSASDSLLTLLTPPLEHFLSLGVRNTIITLGSHGLVHASAATSSSQRAVSTRQPHFLSAEKVEKVVDTTGAGDTFVGAYAVGVVKGLGVGEAVGWANRAAGRKVGIRGAQGGIPFGDEV
ncbi:MAG: hypothetical protein M1834_004364 [Cirrosporium novae-zelandiae]|nr:MAG: hypothetical protein M1834_004364 [Cirrosporium novae-zelandiae]